LGSVIDFNTSLLLLDLETPSTLAAWTVEVEIPTQGKLALGLTIDSVFGLRRHPFIPDLEDDIAVDRE
jgi:hypothetical protein